MAVMQSSEPTVAEQAAVRYHCAAVAAGVDAGADLRQLVARDGAGFAAYWRAADGSSLAAVGAVYEQRFTGRDAIWQAQRAWRELRWRLGGDAAAHVRAFCGFAFAPEAGRDEHWQGWPDGLLVLPEWLMWQPPGGSRLVVQVSEARAGSATEHHATDGREARGRASAALDPRSRAAVGAAPGAQSGGLRRAEPIDRAAWRRSVSEAATAVREGRLDKVVLARLEQWTAEQPIRVDEVLQALERDYPEATVFAIRQGGQVFVGATPERLVSLSRGEVAVDCLAGTAKRGADDRADEDFARALLASAKDREEHDAVVRGVRSDLAGLVDRLESPAQPQIRRLKNVLHLFTPVRATPRAGVALLSLLGRLHPTPAVAGLPRQESLAAIARWESMDRGWYAAPIGWVDAEEEGEFVVALRCALIAGNQAVLYAGVGIVADSQPEVEWTETEWKLAPMRAALESACAARDGRGGEMRGAGAHGGDRGVAP